MNKNELRKYIREQKRHFTQQQLGKMSLRIMSSILLHPRVLEADTILMYHSLPDEVNTHDLIQTLYAQGYTVLLPSVVGNDLALHVYEGEQVMNTGSSFGIQESQGALFTDYSKIDLAVIPGMAFTQQGDRLGRGKGFYDRLLPKLHCPLIGIAFPFQILPVIPTEQHDIPMTELISC